MNIGMMIKKYRNQMDLTQEQLSEYLNVSVSAVSQWESKKTIPDVSMLLSLANFFNITLDELFDRTSADKEKEIEEYNKQSSEYKMRGEVAKDLALWREAAQKYPGDFNCLESLAHALHTTVYSGGESEEIEANAKECIAICECILRDCKDSDNRNSAFQLLVHLYSNKDLPFANEEKAIEYAMMAGCVYVSREELLESAYFTDESRGKRLYHEHSNIINYMDLLTMKMYYGKYESEDEKIRVYNTALTLWETLIYDGNYLFFHCRIQTIYTLLALSYGKLGRKPETIDALKKALYHARCFDDLPEYERHYTSVFVKAATSDASKFSKNYTSTNTENVKRHMRRNFFDFLRNDEEFIQLEK